MSETIRDAYDVAVIGAGPAGLAAAALAARAGLATVLIDEQPEAGGQAYRAVASTPLMSGTILGADYWGGGASSKHSRRAARCMWRAPPCGVSRASARSASPPAARRAWCGRAA